MNATLLLDALIIIITRLVTIEPCIPIARSTGTTTTTTAVAAIRISVISKSIIAAAIVPVIEIVIVETVAATVLIATIRIELELILVVRELIVAIVAGV